MLSSEYIYKFYRALDEGGCENHSLLIMRGDEIEFEHYVYPYSADMPHTMFSLTKSIVSLAVGYAIDEGLISLETKLDEFFPDFFIPDKPKWNRITVRALLTMNSNKKFSYLQGMANDYIELFMKSQFRKKDGFLYSNNDVQMLAEIVRRATGENLDDYLYPRLFEPLGIKKPLWETDCRDTCVGGSGGYMTLRDMAKICRCIASGGKYDGRQVIPEEWTREATRTQIKKSGHYGYGYLFWTKDDSFHMSGMMGQLVYYFPEYDAVIASFNNCIDDGFIHGAIRKYLLPAFDGPVGAYDRTLEEYLKDKDLRVIRHTQSPVMIPTGKTYRISPISKMRADAFFPTGLIPKALSSSFAKQTKNSMDRISFAFADEGECRICWYEDDDRVEIRCGLDGKPRQCETSLNGYKYFVWSFAYIENDRLIAVVKPINTLATQIFTFAFDKKTMRLTADGTPRFKDFLLYHMNTVPIIRKNAFINKKAPLVVSRAVELLEKPYKYRQR